MFAHRLPLVLCTTQQFECQSGKRNQKIPILLCELSLPHKFAVHLFEVFITAVCFSLGYALARIRRVAACVTTWARAVPCKSDCSLAVKTVASVLYAAILVQIGTPRCAFCAFNSGPFLSINRSAHVEAREQEHCIAARSPHLLPHHIEGCVSPDDEFKFNPRCGMGYYIPRSTGSSCVYRSS